jgi:hypothetical protein
VYVKPEIIDEAALALVSRLVRYNGLVSRTDPQAHLQELLDELASHRGELLGERSQSYDRVLSGARKLEHVPLVHGMDKIENLRALVETRALISRTARGEGQSPPEQYLGIEDVVYTSAGVLYPDARIAFVLKPSVESTRATTASPWDSGAICRSLCSALPQPPHPARREVFTRYHLTAPKYRTYLVAYVASCYRVWWHYLDLGQPVAFGDPAGALERNSAPARCFEVRVTGRIELTDTTLLAIFMLRNAKPFEPLVADMLELLRERGVVVSYCSGASKNLEKQVREWIRQHLEEATV